MIECVALCSPYGPFHAAPLKTNGPIQSSVSAFVEKNLWEVLACLRSGGHRLFRRESALADKRFIAPAVAGVAQVCVVQFLVYQRMEGASDWQP